MASPKIQQDLDVLPKVQVEASKTGVVTFSSMIYISPSRFIGTKVLQMPRMTR
jgi:hypothetical protein